MDFKATTTRTFLVEDYPLHERWFLLVLYTTVISLIKLPWQHCFSTGCGASTLIPTLRPPRCTVPPCLQASELVLSLTLFITNFGTGGLKASVSDFGSDQFDEKDRVEKKKMEKNFNWFYFIINIGSLIAVTLMVYIEDHLGRGLGYGILVSGFIVALAVFLMGTKNYRYKKPWGSPLTQIAAVVVAVWKKRKLQIHADSSFLYDVDNITEESNSIKKQKLPHSSQLRAFIVNVGDKLEHWSNGVFK